MKAAATAPCSALFCAVCACAGARAPLTAPPPTTAATSAPPASCAGSAPSYQREVAPLLQHYCLGCHAPGGEAGEDHDFSRPAVLSAQRRQLWGELESEAMPPQDRPQPSRAERALLERWACLGAPNDEASIARAE
jgi:hypothetical protein